MTKSIIKESDGTILIELNKKGINAILVKDNEIRIGEFDGVEFREKGMKKEEFVEEIVRRVKGLLNYCPFVKSIVMSDMFYVKFNYRDREVIAFISADQNITYDQQMEIPTDLRINLLQCVKRFKDIFL